MLSVRNWFFSTVSVFPFWSTEAKWHIPSTKILNPLKQREGGKDSPNKLSRVNAWPTLISVSQQLPTWHLAEVYINSLSACLECSLMHFHAASIWAVWGVDAQLCTVRSGLGVRSNCPCLWTLLQPAAQSAYSPSYVPLFALITFPSSAC